MTDIKTHEPLWGTWYIESLLGEGGFGKVYKVRREEFGKTYYSAVKIISIPRDEGELRHMKSEGFDDASMHRFLYAFVTDIISEIDLMRQFRGTSNVVSLEDHQIIKKEDGMGWDILIRMELLTSLSEHAAQTPLSTADVVKLGIHICRALELCAQKNIIHRDIKPDNIFISPYGEYKLGDFGIARRLERTSSGLSKKGTYTYMAPEVFRGEQYGSSVDTYSLGIVLYRFLNQNRAPFMPEYPQPVIPMHRDEAMQKRMSGEPIPDLKRVSPELNALVLKACSYDRDKRFTHPAEMREALEGMAKTKRYESPTTEIPKQPNTLVHDQTYAIPEQAQSYATSAPSSPYPMTPDPSPYNALPSLGQSYTPSMPGQPEQIYTSSIPGQPYTASPSGQNYASPMPGQPYTASPSGQNYAPSMPGQHYMASSAPGQNYAPSMPGQPYTASTPGQNHYIPMPEYISQPSAQMQYINPAIQEKIPLAMTSPKKNKKLPLIIGLSVMGALIVASLIFLVVHLSSPNLIPSDGNISNQSITNEKLTSMVKRGDIPKDIQTLDLSNNNVSDITPLKTLTNLQTLKLNNNQINDLTSLAGLTQLTELHLSGNLLDSSALQSLESLKGLTKLFLNDNSNISDIKSLGQLIELTELNLDGLALDDVTALKSLKKLKTLSASGLKSDNLWKLRAALSQCIIKPESEVLTSDKCQNKLQALDYVSWNYLKWDITSQYSSENFPGMIKAICNESGNIHVEFLTFDTVENCSEIFNANKNNKIIESSSKGSPSLDMSTKNYRKYVYSTTDTNKYFVIVQLEKTFLLTYCDKSESDTIDRIINDLGY